MLRDDGVAIVTINRPERRNALDVEHFQLLKETWERVRDDKAVRVAIVTGAGDKAFCAGGDLKAAVAHGRNSLPTAGDFWLTQRGSVLSRGIDIWKPVIARNHENIAARSAEVERIVREMLAGDTAAFTNAQRVFRKL